MASKSKALSAVSNNLGATIAHLEHTATTDRTDEGSKANFLLREMQSVHFAKYLFFMMDYLRAITTTSEKFQKKQLLIIEVEETIDNLTGELELLKDEPGENSVKFYASLNAEELQLNNEGPIPVQLKGQTSVEYASDNDIQNL